MHKCEGLSGAQIMLVTMLSLYSEAVTYRSEILKKLNENKVNLLTLESNIDKIRIKLDSLYERGE